MSQKISERDLILIGDITGTEKIPLGVAGDLAINPNLLSEFFGNIFLPLDLTANVSVDGNNFDLIFGSPNVLNSFEIFAGGSHLHLSSDIELITNNYSVTGSVFSATLDSQIVWDLDDGIDQATFDLTAALFNLTVPQMSFNNSIAMDISVDDGVDSSSFSSTPVGHEFTGSFAHTEVSPAQITANQNNYDPGPGVWFNLTSDASRNITGWVPQLADGDEITAYNGGSFDIVFTHNDTGNSTASNCFSVPGGASFTLDAGKSVTWKYSASQSRWRLINTTV